ncbi:MAG: tRNA guanosine(34) transglycosylase Tgt [Salibacteraceae bacterium]
MPVGTAATVKTVHQRELINDIKASIILGNTYHLYLRPGMDIMERAGGLHHFMNWDRPILTDSGGYQVFSLAANRKITEEGVRFQSHIDGSRHLFSPEVSMRIQRQIGADIIMAFDECPPYPCEIKYATESMHLTHRWLDRCIDYCLKNPEIYSHKQELFPIVQGSVFKDLRLASAEYIAEKDCAGNAIGGLSVGEPHELMYEATQWVCEVLPKDKPRYLMGVGTPENLLECIALGIDMFDCVLPTRNARHGVLYTWQGIIQIKNKKWADDFSPLDPEGTAWVDHEYSRAYLRHLFVTGEALGKQIASIHNLAFFIELVSRARQHILADDFMHWKNGVVPDLKRRL